MNVRTRIAPSPTGYLHIGTARTALFNYLFAKANGGEFFLRVEDTDKKRNSEESRQSILEGLAWLGLDYDNNDDIYYQSEHEDYHREVASKLLENGAAYKEFNDDGETYAVRLKTPQEGEVVIEDMVQGRVAVPAKDIEDFIILRSDGSPTYMLAVVADDKAQEITHIIRGDDHLTNTFKQKIIYDAMGWDMPSMAHIPLIHGEDGSKLSKRHGALGVMEYAKMGYLSDAVFNYLLRLGWSHGNDEIISREEACKWFDTKGIGKAPSRFDMKKLDNLNANYMKLAEGDNLAGLMKLGSQAVAVKAVNLLKAKCSNLIELEENIQGYINKPSSQLLDEEKDILKPLLQTLSSVSSWNAEELNSTVKAYINDNGYKFPQVGKPLRKALIGQEHGAGLGEILYVLGNDESLERLTNVLS